MRWAEEAHVCVVGNYRMQTGQSVLMDRRGPEGSPHHYTDADNVLGAVHAISKEVVTFTNTGYINSQSAVELLRQLKQKFDDLPITIVLERNAFVLEEATRLGIQVSAALFAQSQPD